MRIEIKTFILVIFIYLNSGASYCYGEAPEIFDINQAFDYCNEKGLNPIEGVWVYPEDKVTVLISEDEENTFSQLPKYYITVVRSEDCNLKPGDVLGTLTALAKPGAYKIELYSEKKNSLLMKPVSCLATLSNDEETLLIKSDKSKLKFRFNLNFNRLLTGFWKIVSTGITPDLNSQKTELPVGMVKIYPSYDGNGSSKRSPRYL